MSLSTVRCRILGHAEIHTRGIRLTPESELQFALALFYCTQAGRDVPRDEIARLFWPKHGLEAARHCLRQAVYRLRVLGVGVRSSAKSTVLDTHLVDSDFAPVSIDGAPASAFLGLEDVEILPGFAPRFSRPFARWVEDFRDELGSRLRRGLVRAISELRARGRYADVERLCRFCLRLDPLNEEATLALAESVALAGGKAEAVGLIDRYEGEIGRYRPELRLPASLLRERISDRLIRRSQASVELPMIGREEDVERVMTAFQRLRGNRAVSYTIVGAAGVGKTRLAQECCQMAVLQGARVVTIATQPSSRSQALFALSQLVDGLLQMPGAIGCAPAALECLRAISSRVSMRSTSLVLDNDGDARFAVVRWSVLDVLEAILSEGPLVIHIDDAHQLDTQSQAILQDAVRAHAGRPLLLLFTMREADQFEAHNNWLIHDGVRHDLSPLRDESCEQLVKRFCALHEETLDDATRERIIQLSGGNAFFLVELLKHRSDLVTNDLPVNVQALLEQRLSRLSPIALTVLRAAAVLGLSSRVERLQRMTAQQPGDILSALTELSAAGMLSGTGTGATCRHDAIRDAVLERTPRAARVMLHRSAARLLSKEARNIGGVSLLWESFHHWCNAGSRSEGMQVALLLGRRLLKTGLVHDAARVYGYVEEKASGMRHRREAMRGVAKAARMVRDWDTVTAACERWRTASEGGGPRHCAMEMLEYESHYYRYSTFASLPAGILDCLAAGGLSASHRLAAAALTMLCAHNHGDERSAQLAFSCAQNAEPATTKATIARLTTLAVFHATYGNVLVVKELLHELVAASLTVRDPPSRARSILRASFGIARYDNPEYAKELMLSALETFERLDLWKHSIWCIKDLGELALSQNNWSEAESWIEKANVINVRHGDAFCAAVEYELRIMLAFGTMDPTTLPGFELAPDLREALLRVPRSRQYYRALNVTRGVVEGDLECVRVT